MPAKNKRGENTTCYSSSSDNMDVQTSETASSIHADEEADCNHTEHVSGQTSRRSCFRKHSAKEAARSAWLPTNVLLLLRTLASAILVGQLTFFSLNGDYNYRFFAVWTNVGFTLAMLLLTQASLLDVVNPVQLNSNSCQSDENTTILDQIAVPLFQVFSSAQLFVLIIFWAFVFRTERPKLTYPLFALRVLNPALAIINIFLSLMMNFRLLYIPAVLLFEGAYLAYFWAYFKNSNQIIYKFMDHRNVAGGTVFLIYAKLVLLAIVTAFAAYGLSCVGRLGPVRRKATRTHSTPPAAKNDEETGSSDDPGESSDTWQDQSNSTVTKPVQRTSDSSAEEETDGKCLTTENDANDVPTTRIGNEGAIDSAAPGDARPSHANSGSAEPISGVQVDDGTVDRTTGASIFATKRSENSLGDQISGVGNAERTPRNATGLTKSDSGVNKANEPRQTGQPSSETMTHPVWRESSWKRFFNLTRFTGNKDSELSVLRPSSSNTAVKTEDGANGEGNGSSEANKERPKSYPIRRLNSMSSDRALSHLSESALSTASRSAVQVLERKLSNLRKEVASRAESFSKSEEHCDNDGPVSRMSRQDSKGWWEDLDKLQPQAPQAEQFKMPEFVIDENPTPADEENVTESRNL